MKAGIQLIDITRSLHWRGTGWVKTGEWLSANSHTLSSWGSGVLRCAKGSRRRTYAFPGACRAKPPPDLLMRFHSGFEQTLCRHYVEGGAECTGPSLAFVPLRGTKGCTQDDSLTVPGMMVNRMKQPTTLGGRVAGGSCGKGEPVMNFVCEIAMLQFDSYCSCSGTAFAAPDRISPEIAGGTELAQCDSGPILAW